VLMWMQPTDIPLNTDISVLGTSFGGNSTSGCGCSVDHLDVDIKNKSTFARAKMAVKYNITPRMAFTVGATFSPCLGTKSLLILSTNRDNAAKHTDVVRTALEGRADDAIRNQAMPFGAEASFLFTFKSSGRSASPRKSGGLRVNHIHYRGCGHRIVF